MVAVTHLTSPASLSSAPLSSPPSPRLSVLSYNVLLPNSVDGWWNYKMYSPPLSADRFHISTWEYRRNLLRERIGIIDADVVCLQEVAPASFEDDFAFMKEDLGYDGVELFKKGRFRPATFWKTSRCELVVPPVHKDRTLLTTFRLGKNNEFHNDVVGEGEQPKSDSFPEGYQQNWHVLNCHLQAGQEGGRRVRQVHEGVGAVFKLAKKLNEEDPSSPLLVMCGDFNGGSECGAVRYLEDGFVDSDFLEDGDPVTSKKKTMPLSKPLVDVPACADLGRAALPPPTLVVPELISLMVEEGTLDDPRLSKIVLERLERIYDRFASHCTDDASNDSASPKQMNVGDVERWLVAINGRVGRGSEFRNAAKEMGWEEPPPPEPPVDEGELSKQLVAEKATITLPQNGRLTLDGFIRVYERELRGGKFWGIAHDLAVLNESLPEAGVYTARFDRMYCSYSLRPAAVLDTLCDRPCPNDVEPSDHLPVAATFELQI